jgi:hypothetical protein
LLLAIMAKNLLLSWLFARPPLFAPPGCLLLVVSDEGKVKY